MPSACASQTSWAVACSATLALCGACCALTVLAMDRPGWTSPLVSWGVHADARHLTHDVGALLLVGSWAEIRVGSSRVLLWCASGVVAAFLLHSAFYPQHGPLMGISAGVWALASAAAASVPERLILRVVACAVLGGVLAVECVVPWRSVLSAATLGGSMAPASYAGIDLHPVPLVHQGCAALGVLMGWLSRRNPGSCVEVGAPPAAV